MGPLLSSTLLAVALIILPGLSFYFDVTPKVVALLAGTALALTLASARDPRWLIRVDRRLIVLVLAFWISLAASALFSVNPALSIVGTNWRRLGLLSWTAVLAFTVLCAAYAAGRLERVQHLLRVSVVAGVISSIYGILQFFGTDPVLPSGAYRVGSGEWTIVRTPGLMGHAAYHAIFLLVPLFSGATLAVIDPSRLWRVCGIAGAMLVGVAIVFSGTRAAMLGGFLGLLCFAVLLRPRVGLQAIMVAALVVAAGVTFYLSPAGQQLRSRTRWFVEDPLGGPRLMMWRDSLHMSAAHLHLGAGLETYSSEFPKFQSLELARSFPDFHHESPHNIFVGALTAQGIPGVLLLTVLILLGGMTAWRLRHTNRGLAAGLGACLLALVVAHQFTSFTTPTALVFFLVIALLTAIRPEALPDFSDRRAIRYSVRGGALSIAAVLFFFAATLCIADRGLQLVQRELQAGRVSEAKGLYLRVLQHQPPGMSADLWYSRAMAKAAQETPLLLVRFAAWREAMDAAVRATRTSEEPHNAWYSLAMLAAAQNDRHLTEHALRKAISASPQWYKSRWTLAKLLQLTGRHEEARLQMTAALERSGGKHPELQRTAQIIDNLTTTKR